MWYLASLGRVLDECEFPGFTGTIKMLRFPIIRFASLRSRCSAYQAAVGYIRVSRSRRLHSHEPGVGNPVSPSGKLPWKWQGLPSSWGTPIFICPCSSTPVGLAMLDNSASFVLLPQKRERKLRRKFLFRGSLPWLLNSLSTLRGADYSSPTQDSLPTAGKALPGGFAPLGSYDRFQIINA
jgi:hypothetical protein